MKICVEGEERKQYWADGKDGMKCSLNNGQN